jgi:hypothetical protein
MPEKEEKIDLDYCLILIDKVSNPSLSEQEVSYLLKDLADCARWGIVRIMLSSILVCGSGMIISRIRLICIP